MSLLKLEEIGENIFRLGGLLFGLSFLIGLFSGFAKQFFFHASLESALWLALRVTMGFIVLGTLVTLIGGAILYYVDSKRDDFGKE